MGFPIIFLMLIKYLRWVKPGLVQVLGERLPLLCPPLPLPCPPPGLLLVPSFLPTHLHAPQAVLPAHLKILSPPVLSAICTAHSLTG